MSVARCREINARLRAAGITVHEWPGWESRGNGQTSAYEGCIVHHSATGYGFAPAVLVNGRPDLAGPLCNYAGNADGSVTVIAAHPANHAGASGGRSMGPLPVTSTFNKRVMGLEIVYPGTQPMTAAQYRTAPIWARIVVDVLGFGDRNRARAHAETSITGKWDPGYADGRTIDMAAFRAAVAAGLQEEEDMELTDKVTWWDGKQVALGDIFAEVFIAARGLNGKPAFSEQGAPVQLPPIVGIRTAVEGLSDDEAMVLAAISSARGDVLTAVAAIDGAPSDEQVADLADKLNAQLGGAYNVTITRAP